MRSAAMRAVALVIVALTTLRCSDSTDPRPLDNSIGVILSAPVSSGAATTAALSRATAAAAAGQLVVYVSLPPGSVPTGMLATITDQATRVLTTTLVVNGGFDPVPIVASVGDTLTVEITGSGPAVQATLTVAAARPLKVVRTSPPSGGRDVPLNATIVIVFSEPIDSTALSDGSIALWQDTTPVPGTFRFGDTSQLRVEFHPATLLASETTYRFQASTAIRGVNGAALDSPLDVLFTTGASAPPTGLTFASVSAGEFYTLGATTTGEAYYWGEMGSGWGGSTTPAPVPGGLRFASVSAGGEQACGVTTDGAAYCWGNLGYGGVRLDSATLRACVGGYCPTPVPVPGGLTFATVSTSNHRCGVTTSGAAYCWGDDPSAPDVTTPRPVPGGLTFAAVSAGGMKNSCGVTTTGDAYCWGANDNGQLGDGTTTSSTVPVKVAGGLAFKTVSAGWWSACGVTTAGAAYCWGKNTWGQLGDGATTTSTVPVEVAGGLTFATISVGYYNTCGVTTAGAAYCWGSYISGVGFVGGQPPSATPVAVPGGLPFATLSTGFASHRCGLTTGGTAYCWGVNVNGELGDGTTTQSAVPVKVAGQQ